MLIFWNKFAQKGYFWPTTAEVNTTIEFCIFKLTLVANFSKLSIVKFGTRPAQTGYFQWKTDKVKIIIELCICELV